MSSERTAAMHTPGPVETLARLCMQSSRYHEDGEFRDAVDAVLGRAVFNAAPDLLAFLVDTIDRRIVEPDSFWGREARALIAKAGKETPCTRRDCSELQALAPRVPTKSVTQTATESAWPTR